MSPATVLEEVRESIATVTINRPEKRNALNGDVLAGLESAFEGLRSRHEVKLIILTGAGDKAFVAGADIAAFVELSPAAAGELSRRGQALMKTIENLGKPVIAALNGVALGGGCELALACSFRIAAPHSLIGQPEAKLGLIPGYGGTQRLPRLVGKGRALEMLLTGDPVTADQALAMGLVNRVVPGDRLLEECLELARRILSVGPSAVTAILEAVTHGSDDGLEAKLFERCFGTEDAREGIAAFLERRPPRFSGK